MTCAGCNCMGSSCASHSHRYHLTDLGIRVALSFTKVHTRTLRPSLSQGFDGCPKSPNRPVATAMHHLDQALTA
jgi:hypothetical protein